MSSVEIFSGCGTESFVRMDVERCLHPLWGEVVEAAEKEEKARRGGGKRWVQ